MERVRAESLRLLADIDSFVLEQFKVIVVLLYPALEVGAMCYCAEPRYGNKFGRLGFHFIHYRAPAARSARAGEVIRVPIQQNVWIQIRPIQKNEYLDRTVDVDLVIRVEQV